MLRLLVRHVCADKAPDRPDDDIVEACRVTGLDAANNQASHFDVFPHQAREGPTAEDDIGRPILSGPRLTVRPDLHSEPFKEAMHVDAVLSDQASPRAAFSAR